MAFWPLYFYLSCHLLISSTPQPLAITILLYFYEFDVFRFHKEVRSYSIHHSLTDQIHLAQCLKTHSCFPPPKWQDFLLFMAEKYSIIYTYISYFIFPFIHQLLLSHFSHVLLCVTPWTAALQAPPSLGFSRQEHWSGLPFPSPMHESEK